MPNAAPEPEARLRDDIAALIGAEGRDAATFGLAVSGGPDSMALLWLAARAFPGRVKAATVDHGLRAEARAEAEMVARWCGQEGIPHALLTPHEPITGSIQSTAREARYALLHDWRTAHGIDWLLTAHHADDQIETLLMRLNRASGVGGLAGIRKRNGHVLRPLLGWRRGELQALVDLHALPHVQDPSNADTRFDRVAMRRKLEGVDWLDPVAASRSAAACAEAEEALDWAVAALAQTHVSTDEAGRLVLDRTDFPREIQRRLIVHMLGLADPEAPDPRGDTLDQAIVQLLCGKRTSIGKWLLAGKGGRWTLSLAPPRNPR